ncbi:hypothetical protein RhiirA4_473675 [Rhizophagus irregularis]|uniref:Uncharacterized protein n=1 Tax=Rhizophagus irregularis TaxID=588596 RepID=A0A2I1H759_9GLOM|nr:hypothetical protein RhiirA4_473675 [Rhizophagus irregularis]
MDIDMSDVEEFQLELVNPELEQELSENDPPREESVDNKDEEVTEIASFTTRFHIKNIIHSNVPVEYPSTSPEGVATIFHIADWTDSNHA